MHVPRSMLGLVVVALLLVCAGLPASCGTAPPTSGVSSTSLLLDTTSVASSITSVRASLTTPDDLEIFLTEASGQDGYYNGGWQGEYEAPQFGLRSDGRMMVRVAGGYGSEPPVYEQATLTTAQREQLLTWLTAADLLTLRATYPPPERAAGAAGLPVWHLQVRSEAGTKELAEVHFTVFPSTGDEASYPGRLKTLVDQLMSYRPPQIQPFIPDPIYVLVIERAAVKGATSALPPEFDPAKMEVALRSADETRYQAVYKGEDAARVRARLDAGRFFYNTESHSYYVYYMPQVMDWPDIGLPSSWLGTT